MVPKVVQTFSRVIKNIIQGNIKFATNLCFDNYMPIIHFVEGIERIFQKYFALRSNFLFRYRYVLIKVYCIILELKAG